MLDNKHWGIITFCNRFCAVTTDLIITSMFIFDKNSFSNLWIYLNADELRETLPPKSNFFAGFRGCSVVAGLGLGLESSPNISDITDDFLSSVVLGRSERQNMQTKRHSWHQNMKEVIQLHANLRICLKSWHMGEITFLITSSLHHFFNSQKYEHL